MSTEADAIQMLGQMRLDLPSAMGTAMLQANAMALAASGETSSPLHAHERLFVFRKALRAIGQIGNVPFGLLGILCRYVRTKHQLRAGGDKAPDEVITIDQPCRPERGGTQNSFNRLVGLSSDVIRQFR
ncbi:hypothetical protein A6A05_13595 [Magnetospirillum moscoviense]|uniref:Uncharacterized protein n=1 Tax=Magnetospirillum moscoviense TaxID=1437059 RepID=A0A178MLC6_9PROT|nr:hypothetical protein A6A05_13595 [Magnetospirillum moscoviense]